MALRRYSRDAKADEVALNAACADVMLDVARRLPQDDDVAVLAAEAVMGTPPWNYRVAIGATGHALNGLPVLPQQQ